MAPENATVTVKALRTPRAAGVAGIVFSVLLTASFVLVRVTVPTSPGTDRSWLADPVRIKALLLGLNLIPFAGIAFLWFIGVIRDRIGHREDRFFASIFLGSGLLFVSMLFVSTAVAGGLVADYAGAGPSSPSPGVWTMGRNIVLLLLTTYAMRMAGVFMISTATIALHVAIMPRWISLLGYLLALVLLVSAGALAWVELLFPFWVCIVSVYILVAQRQLGNRDESESG